MKKSLSIITLAIFIFSCGSEKNKTTEEIIAENNLDEIRAKRAEIVNQKILFEEQLELIDAKISELDSNKKIPLVTSFVVAETVFNHFVELQGNVSTKNLLVIYPEYAGILTSVNVKEGDKVTKGQILAKIDDGGLANN